MSWLECIFAALATWRLTHLVVLEDGPWKVFALFRKSLSMIVPRGLLDCFYCLSLFTSIIFAVLLGETLKDYLLLWLGLSAAAIFLENISVSLAQSATAVYVEDEDQADELLQQERQQHRAPTE